MVVHDQVSRGFTLIELLVVLAIVGTLLALVTPRYFKSLERAKEVALKQDLSVMRESIVHFYNDQNRYPQSLQELVQNGYLKAIPVDPVTGSGETWLFTPPPEGSNLTGMYDIASGATGRALDGSAYSSF